ncbi:glycoside hydrolase family 3 N-terminal domain-containing protein [Granulicoccus phenolivorans]|uniref:glycoside hydrolase family 3 N-terminal domain-containing protein n=1 Tax=Granulicoccus phenolivorans TaxID=266854 RepID=UPI000685C5C2|nr:glycoside hydrolase family 3 N-terminal domain-containing protein [Granulicoccus phenolivorans]
MVSTAIYTRIDDSAPAAFSERVIGILRNDLGFDRVVISDDLGVAKAAAEVPAAERGVRFVRAGGDLAISVDTEVAAAMATGLVAAAETDPELRRQIRRSAERVVALKQHLRAGGC